MQTLGLASEQKPTDGMWKRLFWPTIENRADVEAVGVQGFWLCIAVGVLTLAMSVLQHQPLIGLLYLLVYVLGGMGVREHNLFAAIVVFFCYLLDKLVMVEMSVLGLPGGANPLLGAVALMLLLANVRGTVLARRWEQEGDDENRFGTAEPRAGSTWTERMADRWPATVWPKGQFAFYPAAGLLTLLLAATMALLPVAAKHLRAQRKAMADGDTGATYTVTTE